MYLKTVLKIYYGYKRKTIIMELDVEMIKKKQIELQDRKKI